MGKEGIINIDAYRLGRGEGQARRYDYPPGWPHLRRSEWERRYKEMYAGVLDTSCMREVDVSGIDIPPWCDPTHFWRPNLTRLGEALGLTDPYGWEYGDCLKYVAHLMQESYGSNHFRDYMPDKLTEDHIRMNDSTRRYMQYVDAHNEGDFVLEMGSLGRAYAGRSIEDVRGEVRGLSDRYLLTAFHVGNYLAVDHARLNSPDVLRIACPGDEYDPTGACDFTYSLGFNYTRRDDSLEPYVTNAHVVAPRWGCAVGAKAAIL